MDHTKSELAGISILRPRNYRLRGTSLWLVPACLIALIVAGGVVPPPAAAEAQVQAVELACNYDPASGTMKPVATIQRYANASSSDNRVSHVMALYDGATLIDQLSAGELHGDGTVTQNGIVYIAPGESARVTPWGGAFGDTSRSGAPALVPNHTYEIRVRSFEFATSEQTFRFFTCVASESELDSDSDGLTDESEALLETDPFDDDTDDDVVFDGVEVDLGTNPLDRDSDDGAVRDDREILVKGSDPLIGSDDIPLPYETYWPSLVDMAANDYEIAQGYGVPTRGYYRQVLNLVCSAAGVSEARPAGPTAMQYCPEMAAAVGIDYGEWAGDFPWEVFKSFLPTVDDSEIARTGKQARLLGHALCFMAATVLGTAAGLRCERHLDDIGFSIAGSIHASHHLYPNFVRHAKRIIESANGGARLQKVILTNNMTVMRSQHQLLFAKAVVPGFDAVFEVSGVYKWIAKQFVPFAASCEREYAIREAMRAVLGKTRGDKVFRSTDPAHLGEIVDKYRCKAWMKASDLL